MINIPDDIAKAIRPTAEIVTDARKRSLARIIADLLDAYEPLLKAEVEGTEIVVSEKGAGKAFAKVVVRNVG